MKEVMHFKSQADRLAFLKGGFEEITPKKVEKPAKKAEKDAKPAEKPKKKASKKATKKGAKKDEVSAE